MPNCENCGSSVSTGAKHGIHSGEESYLVNEDTGKKDYYCSSCTP